MNPKLQLLKVDPGHGVATKIKRSQGQTAVLAHASTCQGSILGTGFLSRSHVFKRVSGENKCPFPCGFVLGQLGKQAIELGQTYLHTNVGFWLQKKVKDSQKGTRATYETISTCPCLEYRS